MDCEIGYYQQPDPNNINPPICVAVCYDGYYQNASVNSNPPYRGCLSCASKTPSCIMCDKTSALCSNCQGGSYLLQDNTCGQCTANDLRGPPNYNQVGGQTNAGINICFNCGPNCLTCENSAPNICLYCISLSTICCESS